MAATQEEQIPKRDEISKLASFGEQGMEIVNDNKYQIIDLEIKDRMGFVKETVSRTILYPNKVTSGHRHENHNEHYHFEKGTGLIILHGEDWNQIFKIEPETHLFIEKKTWHQVINTSNNEDLEFTTYFPGPSDRPHLDANTENGKAVKKKKT